MTSSKKTQNKESKSTAVDRVELSRSRQDAEVRTDADDINAMFADRKELYRNTYGVRQVASIPEHKKDKQLHYVNVSTDEVGTFLDRGYLIATSRINGHISEEMIGRANKTGSVPNFGIGQDRLVTMCIPKEWVKERNAKQEELLDNRERMLLGKKGEYTHSNTGISGQSKQVDIE